MASPIASRTEGLPSAVRISQASETVGVPRPCLTLFGERVLVDFGGPYTEDLREVELALASVSFDYGGTRIRCSDGRQSFFVGVGSSLRTVARHSERELHACRSLEGFGLVEVACLDQFGAAAHAGADYVVDPEGDMDALCSFNMIGLPELRELGWRIDVLPTYPCQTPATEPVWFAQADPEADWFDLQLGIEVDGERLNILPLLLELLESDPQTLDLDNLSRSRSKFVAVPLGERRYIPVPPDRLRSILQVLLELYGMDHSALANGCLRLSEAQLAQLALLENAVGSQWIRWDPKSGPLCVRARALVCRDAIEAIEQPRSLRATLRPYQLDGLRWLQHLRAQGVGGVLADDMGLGKTLQTIAHLTAERESGRADRPSMVIAPTSLITNWARELRKFAPQLNVVTVHGAKRHGSFADVPAADVVLTTYPLIVRDRDRWVGHNFHLLVLDEAQAIKNPRSQISEAVGEIDARLRLALSGTPIENSLTELWALFDFLNPGMLGTAAAFRTHFQVPIEKDGSDARLDALRARVGPYILRREKKTVAKDLPPKTEMVRYVELGGKQRDLYESIRLAAHERVRKVVSERGFSKSRIDILGALLKLRQVCCHPGLVSLSAVDNNVNSAKLDLLMTMLEIQRSEGRRVLVFSQFARMLKLIGATLERRRIAYSLLTGATSDRAAVVDSFQNGDADVFLISLKAGGTGLNLTRADTVIHYDPWWNPAAQAQATDRAHRLGQTRQVFVYNLIIAGSVEERILRLQRRKRDLANSILAAKPGGATDLSMGDVEQLFAPLG